MEVCFTKKYGIVSSQVALHEWIHRSKQYKISKFQNIKSVKF
jgi:hypothetical protein